MYDDLKKELEGEILDDNATLASYSSDYSIFSVRPEAVVFPKNTEDLQKLVHYATEKKKQGEAISLTGRSAGTDMTGGPLNDSIIVEFTKYFNHIKEINENEAYAIVEPGVYFRDFEKVIDPKGFMYPPYPASKDLCALGGIISNNSGGERTLEYGQTEKYVQGLSVVLSDGEEHHFEPLSGAALEKKLNEKNFEGELYRKLKHILDRDYEAIVRARPDVSKNSAGYELWNVWDKTTFDMAKLFVGAQGTLGLVTEAKLKLVRKKKYSQLVVIFAKTLDQVPELVEALLPLRPESIESYDDRTLGLALKFFPALLRLMKGNLITLGLQFLPEFLMAVRGGMPKMVLLVELSSNDKKDLEEKKGRVVQAAGMFHMPVRVARNEREAQKYWVIRRQSFNLLHSHVKGREAAPFVDDIIVRPEYMPEFLPKVNAILDRHKDKLIYTIAGHPGNGNFHIIPLVDLTDPETRKIIPQVTEEVYQLVLKYHGSFTAEHNDGLIRTPYLKELYGEQITAIFREVKKLFDPLDIFNPRKKVGGSLSYSFSHLKGK